MDGRAAKACSAPDAGEGRLDAHRRTGPRVHLFHISLEPRQPVEHVRELGPVERVGEHEVPNVAVFPTTNFRPLMYTSSTFAMAANSSRASASSPGNRLFSG